MLAYAAVGAVEVRIIDLREGCGFQLGVFHLPTLTPVGCGLLLYNSCSLSVRRTLYEGIKGGRRGGSALSRQEGRVSKEEFVSERRDSSANRRASSATAQNRCCCIRYERLYPQFLGSLAASGRSLARRPEATAKPPNNSVNPPAADAESISGACIGGETTRNSWLALSGVGVYTLTLLATYPLLTAENAATSSATAPPLGSVCWPSKISQMANE